ncbi:MAG: hypothetical protein V3U12_01820 [Nitrosopumilaceae archaeon]
MTSFDDYLRGILEQILESNQILNDLQDKLGDLDIIKKEISKINGLITVVINKLEALDNSSDDFVSLLSAGKYYLENYDFTREIETMSKLYSNDSNRLKNIRYTILDSLQDKKLMEKIETLSRKL